jgi:L-2-hydroxycarboxylate dehydrogenase (NAD+)
MYHAAQKVIAMARGQGMAMVGINNSWMSGRSAYYVDLVARAGLVALHTVSSRAHVAAPGSMGPVTGTNPVAFGFPTLSDPFVIDLGTSAFMGTDLQLRERMGTPLPEGVAMDAEGKITTDPLKVATILPFGGYKGFALSMAMQALGVLAGSGFGDDKIYGYFIMAIDPERMLPAGDFRQHMSDMLATVKAAPRQPGVDEIRLPGERSVRERARLVKAGLEIDRQIYDALLAVPRGTLPPLS